MRGESAQSLICVMLLCHSVGADWRLRARLKLRLAWYLHVTEITRTTSSRSASPGRQLMSSVLMTKDMAIRYLHFAVGVHTVFPPLLMLLSCWPPLHVGIHSSRFLYLIWNVQSLRADLHCTHLEAWEASVLASMCLKPGDYCMETLEIQVLILLFCCV